MHKQILGMETEYSTSMVAANGSDYSLRTGLRSFLNHLHRELEHVLDLDSRGAYLINGARFYIDYGQHPEYATPECGDPTELVSQVFAGDKLMLTVADRMRARSKVVEGITFLTSNVEHSGSHTTCGCHESYSHRGEPSRLAPVMTAFLVSRLIWSGAGGIDNTFPGVRFLLSPRVAHIHEAISGDSTRHRPIFHTKNEPLCSGYNRLHVICGDSIRSHVGVWLKGGVTAVVLALAEAGLLDSSISELALQAPVSAMHKFAADPSVEAPATLASGPRVTAIELQRRYHALAERYIDHPCLPEWGPDVIEWWGDTLEKIERTPRELATTFDWAIKRELFEQHLNSRGLTVDDLPALNTSLVQELDKKKNENVGPRQLSLFPQLASILAGNGRVRRSRPTTDIVMRSQEPETLPPELQELLEIRRELCVLDLRFGQLGEAGIFNQLDAAGLIDHHVPGVDVERATKEAPRDTRAAARSRAIQELRAEPERARKSRVSWNAVYDGHQGLQIRLRDPFQTTAVWENVPDESWDDDDTPY